MNRSLFGFVILMSAAACGAGMDGNGEPTHLAGIDDTGSGPNDELDDVVDDTTATDGVSIDTSDAALATTTTRFGMVLGPDTGAAIRTKYKQQLAALDATSVRLWFSIVKFSPVAGSPDWYDNRLATLKTEIADYAGAGFRVNIVVSSGDCRSSPCPGAPVRISGTRADGSPKSAADTFFERFVSDLGPTYLNKISVIEVWNEWDHVYGNYSAKTYTQEILRAGYNVLHTHAPHIQVVAGSVVTGQEGDIAAIVKQGAASFADAFSYHPYVHTGLEMSQRLATVIAAIPAKKGLYLSEWGCKTTVIADRATCLQSSFGVIRAHNVTEADYYTLFSNSATSLNSYSLLTGTTGKSPTITGEHQPLYNAYKNGVR